MATYIALLRGINVGGNKMIAMADLRDMCGRLGYDGARTVLQSGNLVFEHRAGRATSLEQTLEKQTERRLGVQTTYFVRTTAEWDAIIAGNPMRKAAASDPSHLLVYCLKSPPARGAADALRAAITGPEIIEVDDRVAYLYYGQGIGTSKVTPALLEKKLGTSGTGRNWNTVLKLATLAAAR